MLTKTILAQAREEMLRRLVDLASEGRKPADAARYRQMAQDLVNELAINEKASAAVTVGPSIKYAHHPRAIEAIIEYLDEVGRPATEDEIIRGLCDGGFRGAKPGTALVIQKSIRSYLYGTGLKTAAKHPELAIKMVGNLIGRADWGPERFGG